MVALAIRRPVAVFIFAVAAVIFGLVAYQRLATDLLPDVTYPSLTLRTEVPGAAPVEIENSVTRPLEDAVGVVSDLLRVSSSSRAEISEVTLEFAWGTQMDFAALEVRERLDVLRLPPGAEPPVLLRYDPSLDPVMRLGLADGGGGDLTRLRRVAERSVQRVLERLEGVAAVVVEGGLEEEIQVELDELRMAALGLQPERVLARLAEENVNVTGGRLRDGESRYMVRTVAEILRPGELGSLIVTRLEDGTLVRLEDVAEVRQGFKEREVITRLDGAEAVEVAIFKAGGANTVAVARAVRAAILEVESSLARVDPNLRLELITDQARFIESAIREVLETAALGGFLAVFVLYLFLRSFRATAIIGVAIPISVIATFFLMYAFEVSLNIMSLGGLTLGIGLLVDNAIVVLEAVERKRREGLGLMEAARTGAGEMAPAVTASTLTTLCVFLPILFVEGVAAQFFTDQALTVTFSLLASLAVALTVIPMLASRPGLGEAGLQSGESEAEESAAVRGVAAALTPLARLAAWLVRPLIWLIERPALAFEALFSRFAKVYGQILDGALARPLAVVLVTALLAAATLPLLDDLGSELVPELVQGEFFFDLELPPGTHLAITERRFAALEQRILGLQGIGRVHSRVGSTGQQGGITGENREHLGRLTVAVGEPFSRQAEEDLVRRVREVLREDPEITARFGRPSYFSFEKPVEIELRGFNLALLRRLSDDLVSRLEAEPGFEDVESSAEGGTPELQILFDRARLAALDLSVQEVAGLVRTKVLGEIATEIQREDRTVDIRLRAAEQFRSSASDLRRLAVVQSEGTSLPLEAVAEVIEAEGPAEIRRTGGERAALVTANLVGLDLATAGEIIEREIEALGLPADYDWRLGGQQREMERSFGSLRLALALAVFLVYLVMASQFESLRHPLIILFSVPLAAIGVIVTLRVLEVRLSVVVLIGAVLLAGIVVNNAIILVDTANRRRRAGEAA
ncbi:MAG: efflux RND transporter permease subunit, partial [Acidobacteriota bacterium]